MRPLPGSQVVRLALSAASGSSGTAEISWDAGRYRETRSSAGLTIERGIQGGKAYLRDEDGITRVASEPVLAELTTRSFFWRRAWLFSELDGARIDLGPADGSSVSVVLRPHQGNRLVLTFSRDGRRLLSARSPGMAFAFRDAARFRDESLPGREFDVEVRSVGLPTGPIPDAAVGGWVAKWERASGEAPMRRSGNGVLFPARISGLTANVAFDASEDGLLRVSPRLAEKLGLSWTVDVLGRRIARGSTLELPGASFPGISVEAGPVDPPEADAVAASVFLRECVVELDGVAARIAVHDPGRWVAPDGFFRVVLDDDGNRPVGVLNRGSDSIRVVAGAPQAAPLALLPDALRRLGLPESETSISGVRWGAVHLPALRLERAPAPDAERGEDGRAGLALLLDFHVFMDLPHRWIYLKPSASGG
jgi:hypothetical protein